MAILSMIRLGGQQVALWVSQGVIRHGASTVQFMATEPMLIALSTATLPML